MHQPTYKNNFRKSFFPALCLLFFLCFARPTHAATLSFAPQTTSVSVGDIVSVKVLVNTGGTAVNVAGGTIEFPPDLLQVMSINTASSIFSLWVENPTFSNSLGTIGWNGGIPNPGFSGDAGQAMSVTFMAKAAGNASLLFSNGTVLANDGMGTDVLSGYGNASISIGPATYKASAAQTDKTNQPTITSYDRDLPHGSVSTIKGSTYPSAAVSVVVRQNNVIVDTEKTKSDASGSFTLTLSKRLAYGDYSFTVKATSKDGAEESETDAYGFTVNQSPLVLLGETIVNYASIIIVATLFFAALFGLSLRIIQKAMLFKKKVKRTETSLHRSFGTVKKDIDTLTKLLLKAETKRALTNEEKFFLEKFDPKMAKTEKTISKEIGDLKKLE